MKSPLGSMKVKKETDCIFSSWVLTQGKFPESPVHWLSNDQCSTVRLNRLYIPASWKDSNNMVFVFLLEVKTQRLQQCPCFKTAFIVQFLFHPFKPFPCLKTQLIFTFLCEYSQMASIHSNLIFLRRPISSNYTIHLSTNSLLSWDRAPFFSHKDS